MQAEFVLIRILVWLFGVFASLRILDIRLRPSPFPIAPSKTESNPVAFGDATTLSASLNMDSRDSAMECSSCSQPKRAHAHKVDGNSKAAETGLEIGYSCRQRVARDS